MSNFSAFEQVFWMWKKVVRLIISAFVRDFFRKKKNIKYLLTVRLSYLFIFQNLLYVKYNQENYFDDQSHFSALEDVQSSATIHKESIITSIEHRKKKRKNIWVSCFPLFPQSSSVQLASASTSFLE